MRNIRFETTFKFLRLFPTASLRTATDEGAVRPDYAIDPLGTAATLVVEIAGRAGRIVSGVNGQHGIGLVAESIVRLLYDFSYTLITCLISAY